MDAQTDGKLVVEEGFSPGREFELTQPQIVIGRDEANDLTIPAPSISRRHALIVRQGNRYFIEDLNSGNGTFVNGQRLEQRHPLLPGDKIGLGRSVILRFIPPPALASATILEADLFPAGEPERTMLLDQEPPSPPEPPQLWISFTGRAPQPYPLTGQSLTLGRADHNDIVVASPLVSSSHARLERVAGGYRLVVLSQASNPVLHKGQPLTGPHRLQDGDELRIGQASTEWQVTLTYKESVVEASPKPDPESVSNLRKAEGADPATALPMEPPAAGPDAYTMLAQDLEVPPAARPDAYTMLAQDLDLPRTTTPPQFSVQIAGQPPQTITLSRQRVTIGRAEDNDIIVASPIVSRHHAYLERIDGGFRLVPLPDTSNPVLFEGRPLDKPRRLQHEDKLRIGGMDPGSLVTLTYVSPQEAPAAVAAQSVNFGQKTALTIGRDPDNDIVVDNPIVSRYHAQIERVGQRYRLTDLRSANGTFVNDQSIEGDVWLQPDDQVRIGPYRFVMGKNALAQYDESAGLRVEAVGLNKWVRKDLNILQDISLVFQPREFIVVVGQSGGGKTTLLDSIAGYRPASHGQVRVNDISVYKNFDAIRNDIGYVPQKDIIHMELTVYEALNYAAQLRMPPDTTSEERHQRILQVLEDLDLVHRKDTQIVQLSGGQQKRVSIGVELLTKPGLFFLDEPTSGLDPGTETALMQLMRRLADQGRTIVLITHATKNVMLADKVVFLARGGYLAWFGPPDEALEYFDQYRSVRDRRAREIEFDEIYAILDDQSKGSPQDWAERYRNHPAYRKVIEEPLRPAGRPSGTPAQPGVDGQAEPAAARPKRRQVSSLRQFLILSRRNIKILARDRFSLGLMLAAAPLVSLLQVVLAGVLGRNPFDFTTGQMPVVLIILFLPTIYAVMVGGLAQMREIVKEQDIYKRERLVNLRIIPYIMSKIWVAALLALYQTACYVLVHNLAFDMPGGLLEIGLMYVSLALATMAGMMLGLFSSALAPNANSAPLIVILLMVPHIVLGGALVPLPGPVTAPIATRWAFQAMMAISGPGSDVAADACWALPPEQRESLDLEFKNQNCNCMGVNAQHAESCNFPGLGEFYTAAIDEPPPQEPPGNLPPDPVEPARPELPPEPVEPADQSDQVAQAQYLEDVRAWRTEVDEIQAGYEVELDEYRANGEIYRAAVEAYQESLAQYQVEYSTWLGEQQSAIVPAEGMIRQFQRDFGWTFVNKEDSSAYWRTLTTTWLAQSIIIGVLLLAILVIQKRKDIT
jgi:ABC-type multidrug transport system ATPase subunit